jgi:hypothetical protein
MTRCTLDGELADELLDDLRQLAAEAENYFLFGPGREARLSGRLFVDAGLLPPHLNALLLKVIRGVNDGQQLFAQGAVFGFMTDDARILCKAACTTPSAYWMVVNGAAACARHPKLTHADIRRGLASVDIDADTVDTSTVRESYLA